MKRMIKIAFAATAMWAAAINAMGIIGSTTRTNHPAFDHTNDLLLCQFDCKPDPDDTHSQAAVGCILFHPDYQDVRAYGVHGTWGWQPGNHVYESSSLMNRVFGPENQYWTYADVIRGDRYNDTTNNWAVSVQRIADKVQETLNNNGRVWVMEAGQSEMTADWLRELIDQRGMDTNFITTNVFVVQHHAGNQNFNETRTRTEDLTYVQTKTTYMLLDDGNRGNNSTPKYSLGYAASSILVNATNSVTNPNTVTRALWIDAVRTVEEGRNKGFDNDDIYSKGGMDFSDTVEAWWILGLGASVKTIPDFADDYIFYVGPSSDVDGDGIDDSWEAAHFGRPIVIDGTGDSDGDGNKDFFEYLYGSSPTNAASIGFGLTAKLHSDGIRVAGDWSVKEEFTLGQDYGVAVSSNLISWEALPSASYDLTAITNSGMQTLQVVFPESYGPKAFFKFSKP